MLNKAFSVLIPDAEVPVALNVVRCLAQCPNVELHLLSSKRWNPSRFSRHHHSHKVRSEVAGPEAYLKTTLDILQRFDIDVVLPVSLEGIAFVSENYPALSAYAALPSLPDQRAFRIAGNKWLLTEIAREHHIPVPQSVFVTLDSAFYQQLSSLDYPVLLKPTIGQGGRGISQFESAVEIREFLEAQDEEKFKKKYLVQSYVPGSDLGLSVLCRKGEVLAFTVQEGLASQNFGPLRAMRFIKQEDVIENGHKLVSALEWSGVAHVDMRYDSRSGQVKILEVNPRYWLSLLGSLVVSVNFPYLHCLEALGIPFSMPEYELGQYVHTGPAIKETLLRLFGKGDLGDFAFSESGLRFFFADPVPELVDYAARGVLSCYDWRFFPFKLLRPLEGFLSDWFPREFSRRP